MMAPRHEFMTDSSGPAVEIPPMAADEEVADPEARVRAWMQRAHDAELRAEGAEGALNVLLAEFGDPSADSRRIPVRADHDILITQQTLLEAMLAELKHVNARVSAGESRSSASVKSSARGYDVDCKSYADGLENEALDNAIAMYARGMRELDALKANEWRQTVDAEQAKRDGAAS